MPDASKGSGSLVGGAIYDERYLAFVDVLGFSSLVASSASEPTMVEQIYGALSDISTRTKASRSDEMQMEATSFSDTVIISTPVGDAELLHLLEVINEFSFGLLSRNMLFRGALVQGRVLHRPDLIFGPALIAGYRLESERSFHPRIMLDSKVFGAVQHAADPFRSQIGRQVIVDNYDVPYLDPFARWNLDDTLALDRLAELIQLQEIVAAGLIAGSDNPSVGEKYRWLGRKLNRFLLQRNLTDKIQLLDFD